LIRRPDLEIYLNKLLEVDRFNDYAPNGLQVEGKVEIDRIATAVTASAGVIEQALAWGADALLVHHGYFWRGENAVITGMKRERISKLLKQDVNLFAYHLPLDCHLVYGNNASLAKLLDVHSVEMHDVRGTKNLLWTGSLNKPQTITAYQLDLQTVFNRLPMVLAANDNPVQKIAWCSGAAQDFIHDAHNLKVDAYLSGEVSERTYYEVHELGISYIACGHHATERLGVQALGVHLAQSFLIQHQFFDTDNPV